jgi:mono/diheme cytochrome c family protein
MLVRALAAAALATWCTGGFVPAQERDPAEHAARVEQFERDVRPLLAAHCFACHGPDAARVKGGLRISGRAALLAGGESGPALVPGDPGASLLVRAVRYEHPDVQMPPKARLSAREIDSLVEWVAAGAVWPEAQPTGEGAVAGAPDAAEPADTSGDPADSTWWSFQPVVRPALPAGSAADAGAGAHPVDAFIDARLAAAGLSPLPQASPRELVRRAHLDLLGLPPTFGEIQTFEQDSAPDRWERLIDRLLARPEYGERMARHWLDLARFAQTNGYERDTEKPYAWRYRDWVVSAFERDMPYDRFLRAQLAGDELGGQQSEDAIGTGLLRIGPWDDEPDDPQQARADELDDIARVVGEGMLGLTIGCARCHDHKFDPLPQRDYYALVAHLGNLRPYAPPELSLESATLAPIGANGSQLRTWFMAREAARARLVGERDALLLRARSLVTAQRFADVRAEVRDAFTSPAALRSAAQVELVAQHASREFADADAYAWLPAAERRRAVEIELELNAPGGTFEGDLAWALVAKTSPARVPTHVLARGRASSPGEVVEAAPPRVLAKALGAGATPHSPAALAPLGSRAALAEWVTSPANPLTARVWANRVWKLHFGRGIAATPSDFGRMGVPPTHPELLDWLASELVARGWSTKALQRLLLTSRAYRRSSRAVDADALASDPTNELYWRQNAQRLDAESVHDAMLCASGELSAERGGRGYFPELSRDVLGGASRPGEGWELSSAEQRSRRALYAYAKRGVRSALIEAFDGADPSLSIGVRASTTTATQALVLLNGDFAAQRARATARELYGDGRSGVDALATRAFERVLARAAQPEERVLAARFLASQEQAHTELPGMLSFQPRVPARVARGYLRVAGGEQLLYAPEAEFEVVPGVWGSPYNDTLEAELARGPAALWTAGAATAADLALHTGLRLRAGCEIASLYLRAHARETWIAGLELRFDPLGGEVSLWRIDDEAQPLGAARVELPVDAVLPLLVELRGERCTVRVGEGEDAQLDVTDTRIRGSGTLGARAVGAALDLVDPRLDARGAVRELAAAQRRAPLELALESLCLALFNTSEFIHRD